MQQFKTWCSDPSMRTFSGLLALKSFSCQLERFIFIIQREHSTQPFSPLSIGKPYIYTVYSIEEECTRTRGKVVILCLAVLNRFNNENEFTIYFILILKQYSTQSI
jgi:hypothetical protein